MFACRDNRHSESWFVFVRRFTPMYAISYRHLVMILGEQHLLAHLIVIIFLVLPLASRATA